MNKKLSVIIPVFNEEHTVGELLWRVAAQNIGDWEKEIVVVDDGSEDKSKVKMKKAKIQFKIQNCTILFHERNQGKGAAIRTALVHATGDYVLIQDADLEYDPADWPVLLAAAEENPGAAIYGSRNLHPERRGYRYYVWGVWLLTKFTNLLFGSKLTDVYTGYKLTPISLLRATDLSSRGFEFEAEVTAKLLKGGIPIKEVPIRYNPRTFAEGKKIRFRDGLKGLWIILKYRFL